MNLVTGLIVIFFTVLSASSSALSAAESESIFPEVAGEIRTTIISGNETLMEVARREGFGFDVVVNSNRAVDPWSPGNGTEVILPGKVNCSQMREVVRAQRGIPESVGVKLEE